MRAALVVIVALLLCSCNWATLQHAFREQHVPDGNGGFYVVPSTEVNR